MPKRLTLQPLSIEEAFLKLSASVYFDKQNLHLRHKLASFISTHPEWKEYLHRLNSELTDWEGFFDKYKESIKLLFLPKSTKKNNIEFSEEQVSGNFYTNQVYLEKAKIDRISVFIDAPIEFHIVSVLWLMRYGVHLDRQLTKHCIGNRLHLDKNGEIIHSRTLFQRYEKQYQKWWSNGIQAAKDLFDKKEDVTIVNFDFKDYYHSIELNIEELTDFLRKKCGNEIDEDPIHKIFISIHHQYAAILATLKHSAQRTPSGLTTGLPLPIGLLSSYVIANWYLKKFDDLIMQEVNPVYYGRYVDDLMLVIKNTVIPSFNKNYKNSINISDENSNNPKYEISDHYIDRHFKAIFSRKPDPLDSGKSTYYVNEKRYDNIQVQLEKFFIYQFNSKLSPNLLNRFVEEQRERASAFQFLSDDEDDVYKDIDEITFESNFEYSDVSKSRFKNLDDNKYKLSVYLAKLIRGSVTAGGDYQSKEIIKLKKYFKGYYLIKNYYFWEKLFTLFTVRKEHKVVFNLYLDIQNEINRADVCDIFGISHEQIKEHLFEYLEYSLKMALGLNPSMLTERTLTARHREVINTIKLPTIFRDSGLLRKSGMYYPLLQFTTIVKENSWPLFDKDILNRYFDGEAHKGDIDFNVVFPYRIKFYEACLFIMNKSLRHYLKKIDLDLKRYNMDFVDLKAYLDNAFDVFKRVNYLELFSGQTEIKNHYFKFYELLNSVNSINTQPENPRLQTKGLSIPNSNNIKDTMRVCMVNKYVDGRDYEKSLEQKPNTDSNRFEEFNVILDDVKRVKDADIFVMPELCLPYEYIYYYVTQTTFAQIGLVSGIEHWTVGNLAFNFMLTCLPIEVFGDKDSVPIFRLKNHYAPVEEEWIQGKRLVVPKPKPYRYELINWRGVYFSTYNCFELANIYHRHLFYGMLDVVFAPVWNPDIHYYNSLVETASRDMHCFIALSNTTQYGDSRVIEPSGHVTRDKLRVKGGAIKGHRSAILIVDLKIKLLRYFQTHEYKSVSEFNKKYQTEFKPLPPDYPFELANLRYENKLFDSFSKDS